MTDSVLTAQSMEQLVSAIETREVKTVKISVAPLKAQDFVTKLENGNTLLHYVFSCQNVEIIELFVTKLKELYPTISKIEALFNLENDGGFTPVNRMVQENLAANIRTAIHGIQDPILLGSFLGAKGDMYGSVFDLAKEELNNTDLKAFHLEAQPGIKLWISGAGAELEKAQLEEAQANLSAQEAVIHINATAERVAPATTYTHSEALAALAEKTKAVQKAQNDLATAQKQEAETLQYLDGQAEVPLQTLPADESLIDLALMQFVATKHTMLDGEANAPLDRDYVTAVADANGVVERLRQSKQALFDISGISEEPAVRSAIRGLSPEAARYLTAHLTAPNLLGHTNAANAILEARNNNLVIGDAHIVTIKGEVVGCVASVEERITDANGVVQEAQSDLDEASQPQLSAHMADQTLKTGLLISQSADSVGDLNYISKQLGGPEIIPHPVGVSDFLKLVGGMTMSYATANSRPFLNALGQTEYIPSLFSNYLPQYVVDIGQIVFTTWLSYKLAGPAGPYFAAASGTISTLNFVLNTAILHEYIRPDNVFVTYGTKPLMSGASALGTLYNPYNGGKAMSVVHDLRMAHENYNGPLEMVIKFAVEGLVFYAGKDRLETLARDAWAKTPAAATVSAKLKGAIVYAKGPVGTAATYIPYAIPPLVIAGTANYLDVGFGTLAGAFVGIAVGGMVFTIASAFGAPGVGTVLLGAYVGANLGAVGGGVAHLFYNASYTYYQSNTTDTNKTMLDSAIVTNSSDLGINNSWSIKGVGQAFLNSSWNFITEHPQISIMASSTILGSGLGYVGKVPLIAAAAGGGVKVAVVAGGVPVLMVGACFITYNNWDIIKGVASSFWNRPTLDDATLNVAAAGYDAFHHRSIYDRANSLKVLNAVVPRNATEVQLQVADLENFIKQTFSLGGANKTELCLQKNSLNGDYCSYTALDKYEQKNIDIWTSAIIASNNKNISKPIDDANQDYCRAVASARGVNHSIADSDFESLSKAIDRFCDVALHSYDHTNAHKALCGVTGFNFTQFKGIACNTTVVESPSTAQLEVSGQSLGSYLPESADDFITNYTTLYLPVVAGVAVGLAGMSMPYGIIFAAGAAVGLKLYHDKEEVKHYVLDHLPVCIATSATFTTLGARAGHNDGFAALAGLALGVASCTFGSNLPETVNQFIDDHSSGITLIGLGFSFGMLDMSHWHWH